ncbi:MAG TPA: hypothetical protein VK797_23515 [Tepidisphaeraceae bacterium]|nr:hypothetical protein [Tepidisphaeraceae bacterium]
MPTESEIDAAVLTLARAAQGRLYVFRDGTFSAEGKGPSRYCVIVGIDDCAQAMIEASDRASNGHRASNAHSGRNGNGAVVTAEGT